MSTSSGSRARRWTSKLPASGLGLPLPKSSADPGAFYRGLLVGVLGPKGVINPVSAQLARREGALLARAAELAGAQAPLLGERLHRVLRDAGAPGSAVDLSAWPSALPVHVPRDVALLSVKR